MELVSRSFTWRIMGVSSSWCTCFVKITWVEHVSRIIGGSGSSSLEQDTDGSLEEKKRSARTPGVGADI